MPTPATHALILLAYAYIAPSPALSIVVFRISTLCADVTLARIRARGQRCHEHSARPNRALRLQHSNRSTASPTHESDLARLCVHRAEPHRDGFATRRCVAAKRGAGNAYHSRAGALDSTTVAARRHVDGRV